ncbi:odorant receptor 82a-like [Ptiloglossa arizonensis]|uniref:odorant receptor 82a-like n=1 Tax=Ptiloglossa arizonensis TaxID=3350558 RepID=UPI003FA1279D
MEQVDTTVPKYLTTEGEFEKYDKYVNLSIQWNRWLLKPIGVWPKSPDTSRLAKWFNLLLNVVCYFLISFLFIPCGLYVLLEVEDVYNKIKLFGPLSFCMMAYLKYYALIVHENDIRECVERIEWDWRNIKHSEDRNIMVASANFGRQVAGFCTFFVYSGFIFYYIAVPISVGMVVVEEENLTFVPMTFPFSTYITDTRHSPANEILFSIQFLGGVLIHGIAAAGCSLAAVFAVHVCGQMKVLMCWLGHLVHGRADMCKTVNGRIASIVSQHVRILKCLTLIEKAVTQISFVEVSGCTLGICLLGYYIIMEWNSKDVTAFLMYTVILISYIFNIFIFCYIGEHVAELCKKVGEMSYMIEWHRLPGNERLDLILIIAMSNSTMKLTAGNFVKLSLSSFSDIVKTSVGLLNMLRTLT